MAEPLLKKGSKGQDVKDLQAALTTLGFKASADGVFGASTENAVKAFQAAHGLGADGVVGPATWTSIDEADRSEPVLKKGSKGLPVRRLQSRISAFGFDTGGVDGRFGTGTETAVKHLQRDFGLTQDGIVGPTTWAIVDALEIPGR